MRAPQRARGAVRMGMRVLRVANSKKYGYGYSLEWDENGNAAALARVVVLRVAISKKYGYGYST
jgi:hypothetical protein